MMTWRLWARLKTPFTENPLYRQVVEAPGPPIPWYTGCAELAAFLLVIPMFLFMGFANGIGWTVGIAGAIAQHRASGSHDLIAITPGGPLATSWALATGVMHRSGTFFHLNDRTTWVGRFVVMGLLWFPIVISPATVAGQSILPALLYAAAGTAVIYLDHIQSLVLCALVGMVVPTYTHERTNAQLTAFAALLSIQLGSYIAGIFLLRSLTYIVDVARLPEGASLFALALALAASVGGFYGLREATIQALWRILVYRLNSDAAEAAAFTARGGNGR